MLNQRIADVIPLTQGTDDWYRKLYSTIKDQQNMPVWVSEDKVSFSYLLPRYSVFFCIHQSRRLYLILLLYNKAWNLN